MVIVAGSVADAPSNALANLSCAFFGPTNDCCRHHHGKRHKFDASFLDLTIASHAIFLPAYCVNEVSYGGSCQVSLCIWSCKVISVNVGEELSSSKMVMLERREMMNKK